ncbi:uncharacterized protein LOC133516071 [Cydia pomonella]|uniref:uncharacterized protein LOC133516071 n=1 Tax=Cydia pomonella TaxID=82600 RepID=UPI002ADD3F75|nr:uncharacterized protein LOC133516071 [Cydia pomonella]
MKVHTLTILLVVTIINCAYSWWDSDFIIVYPTAIIRTDVRKTFLKLSRAKREIRHDLENSKYILGRVKQQLQSITITYTREFARMEQLLIECSRRENNPSTATKPPPAYDYPDQDTPDYDYEDDTTGCRKSSGRWSSYRATHCVSRAVLLMSSYGATPCSLTGRRHVFSGDDALSSHGTTPCRLTERHYVFSRDDAMSSHGTMVVI